MRSRPVINKSQLRHNATPVVAVSPNGNVHLYPSIVSASGDIAAIGATKTRSMQRLVAAGGGYMSNWYISALSF